jgi:hypothetical protein
MTVAPLDDDSGLQPTEMTQKDNRQMCLRFMREMFVLNVEILLVKTLHGYEDTSPDECSPQ